MLHLQKLTDTMTLARMISLVLAAIALFSGPAHASNILYVGDYLQRTVNRYDATNLNVGGTPAPLNPFIGSNYPVGNPSINARVESIRGLGDKIFVAVDSGTINEYDVNTGMFTGRSFRAGTNFLPKNVYDMAISSDGSKLYAATGDSIRMFSLLSGTFGTH